MSNKRIREKLEKKAAEHEEHDLGEMKVLETAEEALALSWDATKSALFLGGAIVFGGAYWLLSNRKKFFQSPPKNAKGAAKRSKSADRDTTKDNFQAVVGDRTTEALNH
ncbi:MAG: hypothetical protein EOP09_12820 [Proteobacteria bacterium]|nr:MAG: hypothetical protein EOP09_12820 [Pseudomonadota bacterium]